MLELNINNETSRLRAVVLGIATSNGPTPSIEDAYDPKSLEHIKKGTYPIEKDMVSEMEALRLIFQKYEVEVFRPEVLLDYNQIFSRDIGFVIQDKFIKANVLPDRDRELAALKYILDQVDPSKIISAPKEVHFEGGDVMLWKDHIFIGTYQGADYDQYVTARTNTLGVEFITKLFPDKIVKSFDLIKSRTNAKQNALHLDCCFQPVGEDKAIIYQQGFSNAQEYQYLVDLFGPDNLFHVTEQEMYDMVPNVFSIAPNVVVSERNFKRLNSWLAQNGFIVETVPYAEIAKQGGLLRCTTLPLTRDK